MIETTVLNYLSASLGDVPVKMEMPETYSTPMVLIQKTGGGKENQICNAVLAIQSYGESLYEAASINEEVKSAMEGLISLGEIAACKLNSDYEFTNTATKRYRYQAIFQITYY